MAKRSYTDMLDGTDGEWWEERAPKFDRWTWPEREPTNNSPNASPLSLELGIQEEQPSHNLQSAATALCSQLPLVEHSTHEGQGLAAQEPKDEQEPKDDPMGDS